MKTIKEVLDCSALEFDTKRRAVDFIERHKLNIVELLAARFDVSSKRAYAEVSDWLKQNRKVKR